MKAFNLILALSISVFACKNSFFYSDIYTRTERKGTLFAHSYSPQNEFCIFCIQACHFRENTGLLATNGRIHFNRDSIDYKIQRAYSRNLHLSYIGSSKLNHFNEQCVLPDKILSSSVHAHSLGQEMTCSCVILPQFSVATKSIKRTEGGGGMTPAFDVGDDKHLLEYKLTTAIYENDTLVYMDNRTHWTEVISERGEQLMYQVPQTIIDSLVTLTLQEYFKRMD